MKRKRKPNFGQMIQLDGSSHAWFEGRGDKACFMGYTDDATNNVFGRFYSYEGRVPALDSFMAYSEAYGIPESMYMDKHTTYHSTAKPTIEEELTGEKSLSQFQRALGELGIDIIYANSPQAKGRIERLFKTLQDRLVKELRLSGIDNIDDANLFLEGYLPKYNKKFSIPPLGSSDLQRKPPADIDSILCLKDKRRLRNDNTISFEGKFYQILSPVACRNVDIEKHLDGNLYIKYNGKNLSYSEIDSRPKVEKKKEKPKKRVYVKPKPNHPWRSKMKGRGVLATKL